MSFLKPWTIWRRRSSTRRRGLPIRIDQENVKNQDYSTTFLDWYKIVQISNIFLLPDFCQSRGKIGKMCHFRIPKIIYPLIGVVSILPGQPLRLWIITFICLLRQGSWLGSNICLWLLLSSWERFTILRLGRKKRCEEGAVMTSLRGRCRCRCFSYLKSLNPTV